MSCSIITAWVVWLALGISYDWGNASEVILNDTGEIGQSLTTAKYSKVQLYAVTILQTTLR